MFRAKQKKAKEFVLGRRAQIDAGYIHAAVHSDSEGWKRDHDKAMQVFELERIFAFVQSTIKAWQTIDNRVHQAAYESEDFSELATWKKNYAKALRLVQKDLVVIGDIAQKLNASHYRDATATPSAIEDLRTQVSDHLVALEG